MFALLAPVAGAALRAWTRRGGAGRSRSATLSRELAIPDQTARVTEHYLLYCMIPLWTLSGLLDYLWHRKTSIETTSGTTESLIHALMMSEAGIPMMLGLLLEINAGVILLMIAAFFAHAATAIWDVSFAVERRKVTPAEQHIHSFLEVLPFCAVSVVICLHSEQFLALFGVGAKPSFALKRKNPPISMTYMAGASAGVLLTSLVYGDELMRCLWARQKGLTGVDTPPAARELYQS